MKKPRPVVLTMAGHDPGGGAGIQADIESILANHCRPVSIVTSLTAQNRQAVGCLVPQNSEDFRLQLQFLREEVSVDAIKIGMIGSSALLHEILECLDEDKSIPVVFDPVLCASNGDTLMEDDLLQEIKETLLSRVTIITPNSIEARHLSQKVNPLQDAAEELIQLGCRNILITGSHEKTDAVINTLFMRDKTPIAYSCKRLAGEFHGSGCTLSAAMAAQLALGKELESAVKNALDYTWQSLAEADLDENNYGIPGRLLLNYKKS